MTRLGGLRPIRAWVALALLVGLLVPALPATAGPDGTLPFVSVPATTGTDGVDTGVDVFDGQIVVANASGTTTYGNEGGDCPGVPVTTADGHRSVDGSDCPPKVDSGAPVPDAPIGALIGRIGDGAWFLLGSSFTIGDSHSEAQSPGGAASLDTGGQEGRLYLGYNDPGSSDNTGAYSVELFVVINVPADAEARVRTGVHLGDGQEIYADAHGTATYGNEGGDCPGVPQTDPDGNRSVDGNACPPKIDPGALVADAPIGALVGKIGTGDWFLLGGEFSGARSDTGELFLAYNDANRADNTGHYGVVIYPGAYTPPPPPPPVCRNVSIVVVEPGTTTQVTDAALAANRRVDLLAVVRDCDNVRVQGEQVTFTITWPGNPPTRTGAITTDANGRARTPFTASDVAGSAHIVASTATLDPHTQQPFSGERFITQLGAPPDVCRKVSLRWFDRSGTTQLPDFTLQQGAWYRVVASVTDCNNQPVAGERVSFALSWPPEPGQPSTTARTGPVTTGPKGQAYQEFRTSPAGVGTMQIVATTASLDPSTGRPFTAETFAYQARALCRVLSLTWTDPAGNPLGGTVPADGTTRVRALARLTDCNRNPVDGEQVRFTLNVPGLAAHTTDPVTTAGGGYAYVLFTTSTAQGTGSVRVATVANDPNNGRPFSAESFVYQETPARRRTTYVALGDSFSSGEAAASDGSRDLAPLSFFPSSWEQQNNGGTNCHQSRYAYSQVLAAQMGIRPDAAGVRGVFPACSGGVIENVFFTTQYAGEGGVQINKLPEDARLVTISIGGNDLGFAGILTWCNVAKNCQNGLDGTYGTYQQTADSNIRAMYPRLYQVYKELRRRSGNAPVFVMAYPTILSKTPTDTALEGFDQGELDYLLPRFDVFKQVAAKAAADAGVHFVDPDPYFEPHFTPKNPSAPACRHVGDGGLHRYGERDTWFAYFNNILEQDGRGKFPFHPNVRGHAAMACALIDAGASNPEANPNPPQLFPNAPDPSFATPDHWWAWDKDSLLNILSCARIPGCEPQIKPVPINKSVVPNSPGLLVSPPYIAYDTDIPNGTRVDSQSKKFCAAGRSTGPHNNGLSGSARREWYFCGSGYTGDGSPSVKIDIAPGAKPQPPTVLPGRPIAFTINGGMPFATGTAQVFSTPRDLGTFEADANGTFSFVAHLPTDLEPGAHTFKLTTLGADGAELVLEAPLHVVAEAGDADDGGSGSASTDAAGDGATADDPVEVRVTAPAGGAVSAAKSAAGGVPDGYRLLGSAVDAAGPVATAQQPLRLTFSVDASAVAPGAALVVFRNGERVAGRCAAAGVADPDPCVERITPPSDGDDDWTVVVLTTRASRWAVAVPTEGSLAAACPGTGSGRFDDVTGDNVHRRAVDCIAEWEIGTGQTPGVFAPAGLVTRAQMAAFLARLLERAGVPMPSAASSGFGDIGDSIHADRINQLAELGVVHGRSASRFAPQATVSRAEMASFLVRTYEVAASRQLAARGNAFDDASGSVHEENVELAAAAGLVSGVGDGRYAPDLPVRRDQMASFLARLLDRLVVEGAAAP